MTRQAGPPCSARVLGCPSMWIKAGKRKAKVLPLQMNEIVS